MYNESKLAREAKVLLKTYLRIPDGAAQDQVERLTDGDLADIVAAGDYPYADRREAIVGVLARVAQAAVPPAVHAADDEPAVDVELVEVPPDPAEAATDEDGEPEVDEDDEPAGE